MHHEIEQFLRKNIDSYEQLEVLLSLHGSAGDYRSVAAIASELGLSMVNARQALFELAARNLVCQRKLRGEPEYGFPFWNQRLAALVIALDQAWNARPIEVARLMDAAAIERIRTAAARSFSDAFRLNEDAGSAKCSPAVNPARYRKARGH